MVNFCKQNEMAAILQQLNTSRKTTKFDATNAIDEDFVDESFLTKKELTSSTPLEKASKEWKIHPKMVETLVEDGITEFFPVQSAVVPQLLLNNSRLCIQPRDMCVSAPTGANNITHLVFLFDL